MKKNIQFFITYFSAKVYTDFKLIIWVLLLFPFIINNEVLNIM